MAGTHTSKWYSVEDAKVGAVTADTVGGTTTYGTLIDLPGIKSVGLDFDISSTQLTGDNTELDSDSSLLAVNLTFDHAKLSLDALGVFLGGTTTDTGAGSAEVATYRRISTDAFSYFKFEAKTPTSGTDNVGGDIHLLVYKCKITDYSLGMPERDYATFSGTARGVARLSDSRLFDVIYNETQAAIA